MKEETNAVQWITLILSAIIVLGLIFYVPGMVDKKVQAGVDSIDIPAPVTVDIPDFPTAKEIGAEIKVPDSNRKQLQEIWDDLYEDEVEEFEEEALDLCIDEFDWDDVVDLLEAEFGEVTDVQFVDFDEDNQEITIVDLGLDDEDDRELEIEGYFRVSYLPEEGDQIEVIDKIYGTCIVTSDDGDLEADLTLRV